jgi:hypothetical protein
VIGITGATGAPYFVACHTATQRVGIKTTSPSNTLSVEGIAAPETDNAYSCGTAAKRWTTIYAATGTINTSDARDKDIRSRIDGEAASAVIEAVAPALFRWKEGGSDVDDTETREVLDGYDGEGEPLYIDEPVVRRSIRAGKRIHAGWIAQEVKAALDVQGLDCGAWGLDDRNDPDARQWLRPDQLMAILWAALRQTRAELASLKAEVAGFDVTSA